MVDSRPNVWQMQSRQDMQGLIRALQYPDPEVRGRAAVALRTLDALPAVPALKEALQDELDDQARKYLKEALHVLDQQTDIGLLAKNADLDGLIASLKSPRFATVIKAADALGKLGNRLAVEPLIILFHNSTSPPAVRLAAAEALLELKSAPAVVTLLGALRRDSWQVRRNAAAVLGQIQAIWAVEPLAEALDDPHPVVRRSAAAALKRIGTTEAITAIRDAVQGKQAAPDTPPKRDGDGAEDRSSARDVAVTVEPQPEKTNSRPPAADGKSAPREAPSQPASAPHAPETQPESADTSPYPEFDTFTEVERGEIIQTVETRPSESTQPAVRVHRPAAQPSTNRRSTVELDTRDLSRPDDSGEKEDEPASGLQNNQNRSPIARMIAFLRRRGNNNSN